MREAAANACESGDVKKSGVGKLLVKVAQSCYDASDLSQAEEVLKRAVSQFEISAGKEVSLDVRRSADLRDCLRLQHASPRSWKKVTTHFWSRAAFRNSSARKPESMKSIDCYLLMRISPINSN